MVFSGIRNIGVLAMNPYCTTTHTSKAMVGDGTHITVKNDHELKCKVFNNTN
jgi:hypothetical protein